MNDFGSIQVREGDVLAGKYRVERVLGVGGMGVVVRRAPRAARQRVAHQVPLARGARQRRGRRPLRCARRAPPRDQERARRRASSTSGRSRTARRTWSWSSSRGATSRTSLDAARPLPVDAAVDYVLQACEAVAEAHATGIVHRDLKPANLFSSRAPTASSSVKVLDFGVSKSARRRRAEGEAHADERDDRVAALHGARADALVEGRRRARATSGRWASSSSSSSTGAARSTPRRCPSCA